MSLVANWRRVLRHAWSLRLIALAAILSALEVGMSVFVDEPPIARGSFAALLVAVNLAAAIARFVAQPIVHGDPE